MKASVQTVEDHDRLPGDTLRLRPCCFAGSARMLMYLNESVFLVKTIIAAARLAARCAAIELMTGGKTRTPTGMNIEHRVVALERGGLGVFGPVGPEGDLRHLAVSPIWRR